MRIKRELFGICWGFVTFIFTSATMAQSVDSSACAAPPVDQDKAKSLADDYQQRFLKVAEDAQREGDEINKSAPRSGAIFLDGTMETRRAKFDFPLPNVTMRANKIAMDLPETRFVTRKFSAHLPAVITGEDCRRGPDETVVEWKTCRNGFPPFDYPCAETRLRRGKDICLPTIKTEMRREEVSFNIPEIKMVRQDYILHLPSVAWSAQQLSFDYPVFIVKSVSVAEQEIKDKSSKLEKTTKDRVEDLSSAMKKEMYSLSAVPLESTFRCALDGLEAEEKIATEKISQLISSYEAGYIRAKEINSQEALTAFQKAISELKFARDKTAAEFAKAKLILEQEKKAAFAKLN